MISFKEILQKAIDKKASDIHLRSDNHPVFRINSSLEIQKDLPFLEQSHITKMAKHMMSPAQIQKFNTKKEVDLGFNVTDLGRFRVNIYSQKNMIFMAIRHIPLHIKTFEQLELPSVLKTISQKERGLILITGATGVGKSTTCFSILEEINKTKCKHILTIEDPIEFMIEEKLSLISQKEVGSDVPNFYEALRGGLRQDPDIIFLGEMRDKETIQTAVTAAETGHLVISTLHTLNATESINRLLSAAPKESDLHFRNQIASVLVAVISQRFILNKKNTLTPCVEILLSNHRIQNLIRDKASSTDIAKTIEESNTLGMCSFDQSLTELLKKDIISFEQAIKACSNPTEFQLKYKGLVNGQKIVKKDNHNDHDEITEKEMIFSDEKSKTMTDFIKKLKIS